ncbi:MAG: hypothetical protein WBA20_13480 [Ketobacter sp.]
MNYSTGQKVKVGDKVKLWDECFGVVVCSIDDAEYCDEYPKDEWEYLQKGVIINTEKKGLIHYSAEDEDLRLVSRKLIIGSG